MLAPYARPAPRRTAGGFTVSDHPEETTREYTHTSTGRTPWRSARRVRRSRRPDPGGSKNPDPLRRGTRSSSRSRRCHTRWPAWNVSTSTCTFRFGVLSAYLFGRLTSQRSHHLLAQRYRHQLLLLQSELLGQRSARCEECLRTDREGLETLVEFDPCRVRFLQAQNVSLDLGADGSRVRHCSRHSVRGLGRQQPKLESYARLRRKASNCLTTASGSCFNRSRNAGKNSARFSRLSVMFVLYTSAVSPGAGDRPLSQTHLDSLLIILR